MKQVRRILIIGAQATGKSTLARLLSAKIPGANTLVIEPDSFGDAWEPYGFELITPDQVNSSLHGKHRTVFEKNDREFLDRIYKNVFNSCVIFDDSLFLLESNKMYLELSKILGRARQVGNQIIFTIHGVSSVPAPFWNYFTDIFILKTYDKPARSAYKIPNFEDIEKAIERVNTHPNMRAYIYLKRDKFVII